MKGRTQREAGMSLLELSIAVAILSVVAGAAVTALNAAQMTFVQNEIISQVRWRAQRAMERIVQLTTKAVSSDPEYTPFESASGVDSHGLQFRLIEGTDVTGQPVYDDVRVFIFGPDDDPWRNRGIVVGRGPDMGTVHSSAAGPDAVLGTSDDDLRAMVTAEQPYLEILVPETFTPAAGEMLSLTVDPAPFGRLITVTLRLNARSAAGTFLLPQDLVLSERIALRQ